jgi:hypothetical protein
MVSGKAVVLDMLLIIHELLGVFDAARWRVTLGVRA